jgi:hypothetical protein
MQTQRALWVLLLAGLILPAQGCMGRLIGEGAEKARGPKGVYWEEKPLAADKDAKPLAAYRRFELSRVSNDYGRNLPPTFIERFRAEFARQLEASRLPNDGAGKTLLFNVGILHYEEADLADNVFGPLEQVVAHVDLVDKESQAVLASGNAVGRTGKTVGLGVDWKARGLAKALIKWALAYTPKEAAEGGPDERDKGQKE